MQNKFNFKLLSAFALVFVALQLNLKAQYTPATEAKINQLIKQMTLEEKLSMLHANSSFTTSGVKRLGIPELTTSDGPHGVRREFKREGFDEKQVNDSGTYLPTCNLLAATWNPELGYAFGSVLGSEAKWRGKDVILGPGINIIRTPLNGRNFEYLSEDPFLVSKMVVGYVKGVQNQGISACVKHFMANSQEVQRTRVNVLMSERALREIYLPGYKAAVVDGQVNTVMGAYNKFRGQYCTHNDYLVNKILKGEWNFKGVMMSDWGAVHDTYEALMNGTDLEMGTDLNMSLPKPDYTKYYFGDAAIAMVKSGKVAESVVDDKVRRILRVMYKTNMFGKRTPGAYATKEHQATALKIAEEGIVLLKNEDQILPLKKSIQSIAVIGQNAVRENARGGGSSEVKATYEITPLAGLKNITGTNVKITYAQGYKIERNAKAEAALIKEAVDAASKADVAIVVGGWTHGYDYNNWNDNAYDAENVDKPNMDMPFGQDELIQAVLKANPRTIVVIIGGGGIDMSKWVDQTKGIIQAWYPGMEGGNALAKIIFGEVNPSGKLPMSFPKHLADCPAHKLGDYPGNSNALNYKEGIFVGYRYYDTYKVEPQFEFGHGLSYTTFAYTNLKSKLTNGQATVTVSIKNTGKVAGAEVVQLYVKEEKPSVERPDKELKAFGKVFLNPGEEKIVTLQLNADAFQYFDEGKMKWVHNPGKYNLLVGSSSRDIRKAIDITL